MRCRVLLSMALITFVGGSDCARETVSCPEGTAIVDFEEGGRDCVPYEPGTGGAGAASGTGGVGGSVPKCREDIDCRHEEAAHCEPQSGECVPCTEDLHCAGVDGLIRCDGSGLCVECLPPTEGLDCGTTSCNPATFACSKIERSSRSVCERCVSDSDCESGLRCVALGFGNLPPVNGYCLQPRKSGPCAQPFAFPVPGERESLSGGEPALYCGVNEALTTCEAVLALVANESCEDDFDCPPAGLCREVGSIGKRCTYECSYATQCLEEDVASTCGDADGTAEQKYCGG